MNKSLSMLLFVLVITGCAKHSNDLVIIFDRVDGLRPGSVMQNKGITIGKVKNMKLFGKGVVVNISVDDKVQVPTGSQFNILNTLLDNSTIDVKFADNDKYLTATDTLKGTFSQKGFMDDVISDTLKRKEIEGVLKKIASGIDSLILSARKDSLVKK